MSECRLLFVYGLLRPGRSGFHALGLARKCDIIGRDRIHGRLYHLGHYPGLRIGKRGIVHGDVIALRDAETLAEIDAYELYVPGRPRISEYLRVPVDLIERNERVWTYEYNRPVKGKPVIASGNWWSR
jgi:gamma-glutamylcyclotransferase (GGCT)/AIG2-like uncharacterized protein YtfP